MDTLNKEDINQFKDHGDFVSINYTPFYRAKSVSNALLGGVFIGIILGFIVGFVTAHI